MSKDDGHDSGVTSPLRLDSDDSVTSDSGANSSRKESFDSLSGPSPLIQRRTFSPQQSIGSDSSNDQRSPTLPKSSLLTPSCSAVKEEKEPASFMRNKSDSARNSQRRSHDKNDTHNGPEQGSVVKRGVNRRNKGPVSPRASKRELCSILPGDGNEYDEKIRALIDPEYAGSLKEKAKSEMNKTSTVVEPSSTPVSLNGLISPESAHNADWWLSGSQNISRRFVNSPRDKATAQRIIGSAINTKRRANSVSKENEVNSDLSFHTHPLLSPTMGRRIASSQISTYNRELSARTDSFKLKKEELNKKVTSILGPNEGDTSVNQTGPQYSISKTPVNTTITKSNSGSKLSENRSEKMDKYLKQVSELLTDSDNKSEYDEEREKLNSILQNFQQATKVDYPTRRLFSEGSITPSDGFHKLITRSKSANSTTVQKTPNTNRSERTSPLLDTTYSSLNYSKLYPALV